MTSHLAFSDWPTIFPNATCAAALIDRTVHHGEVIAIQGDSYRRRDKSPEIAISTSQPGVNRAG